MEERKVEKETLQESLVDIRVLVNESFSAGQNYMICIFSLPTIPFPPPHSPYKQ